MLNCWDNASGDVERGYAGRSLFFEGGRLDYDPARLRQLGRMLASVGVNALCINNVNVQEPAQEMIDAWLPELAKLAAIFRPFGVRLMVSIDFSHPLRGGLPTADPPTLGRRPGGRSGPMRSTPPCRTWRASWSRRTARAVPGPSPMGAAMPRGPTCWPGR